MGTTRTRRIEQLRNRLASFGITRQYEAIFWLNQNDLSDRSVWWLGEAFVGTNDAHLIFEALQ